MGISYKILLMSLFIMYMKNFNIEVNGVSSLCTNQCIFSNQFPNSFIYISISRSEHKRKYFYKYTNISNFQSKYLYGNRDHKGMRICHWNKSNSSMGSRLPEIKNIISMHLPHIFGVSEANINTKTQDKTVYSISDYNMLYGPISQNGIIRLVVYIHKEITFKSCPDLMSPDLNSIWFEAGFKNKKRILVNKMYREWQQLGIADSVSVPDQLARWLQYIDLWEKALNTGMEVFCQGDYNLNHCM